jgi:TRAP-type C4-dicarboxylate transport system permease large subunit
MDSFGIAILTFPILFPIVIAAGFEPIWFGAYATVLIAVGLISPPVGMNVFILHSVVPRISMKDMFIGVTPFAAVHFFVCLLMLPFPGIATWLPMTMQ